MDKINLKTIANRNINLILDKLGVNYIDSGFSIKSHCPCQHHAGDRSSQSFSWKKDTGYWICWSHHCEEKFGSDIIGLIRSITGKDFFSSKKFLEDFELDESIFFNPIKRKSLYIHKPLPENQLKWLSSPNYLINKGFDPKILSEYKIGFWSRLGTFMHNRVVIPIRDHQNFLIGYSGRTIYDKQWFIDHKLEYKKWIHGRSYIQNPKDSELFTGSILFNLNNARFHIKPFNKLFLVEGPLDGLKLQMAGIKNWVCSLGTSFGPLHRTLLVEHGINDLFVAYDNDNPNNYKDNIGPGDKGFNRVQKIIGNLINIEKVNLPLGKGPGQMDIKEIRDIFIKCLN